MAEYVNLGYRVANSFHWLKSGPEVTGYRVASYRERTSAIQKPIEIFPWCCHRGMCGWVSADERLARGRVGCALISALLMTLGQCDAQDQNAQKGGNVLGLQDTLDGPSSQAQNVPMYQVSQISHLQNKRQPRFPDVFCLRRIGGGS